jgi:hypothetical protein
MQTKSKKTKAKVEPLLDLDSSIVATSTFELKKIEMKDDMAWRIKLELKTRLSQSFREYKVKFVFNEDPYNTRIEDLEKKKNEINEENQLFEGGKKQQLKNIDQDILEIEEERDEMKGQCVEIEFAGTIEELKYKDGNTIIVMLFPSDILAKLNDNKLLLRYYKIELIRE